jgi:deoxyribonuclease V
MTNQSTSASSKMLLALDVYYKDDRAKVVGVGFADWTSTSAHLVSSLFVDQVEPYEPGSFFKRELPCITALVDTLDVSLIGAVVVDGHVYIDNDFTLGLGGRLYETLQRNVPVIGVAKTAFRGNEQVTFEVLRGNATKPLFVSAIGIDTAEAARNVSSMAGPYRIPTLLSQLDRESKTW